MKYFKRKQAPEYTNKELEKFSFLMMKNILHNYTTLANIKHPEKDKFGLKILVWIVVSDNFTPTNIG